MPPPVYVMCSVVSTSFVIPRTRALQASLSIECSSQEYWSSLPFPPLGDPSVPGIEPTSLVLSGRFFTVVPLCIAEWVLNEILHSCRFDKD